ncbi:MAG: hypothetical protein KQH63_20965, partial [Desulfobulbaceae bacterium]|nr:hypothetical protein [Desulfobulbaceae bacterium]
MGILTKGREIIESDDGFQLRENNVTYIAHFDCKKDDIGGQNAYYLDINHLFSASYRGPTPYKSAVGLILRQVPCSWPLMNPRPSVFFS